MNTLLQTIIKWEEEFDKQGFIFYPCGKCDGIGFVMDFLQTSPHKKCDKCNGNGNGGEEYKRYKNWHKQFLISLLESERERLVSEMKEEKKFERVEGWDKVIIAAEAHIEGHNKAIIDQISHINKTLTYLKRDV